MKEKLIKLLLGTAGQFLVLFLNWISDRQVFDKALNLARAHVQVLDARTDIDGETKRAEAVARLKADLRSDGQSLKDSAINLAIELAVAALKSSQH